ncbi:hypothetical protein [Frigidibacter oleivorans]|uniref:hypothetical protein n=1 Tax=Frigidibacter oleivorans TaxID=2487129 RepID=UPI000F8F6877|nr:hypothetical protein [Frigidibacter oleivorans]
MNLEPLTQGRLDCLCSIYAGINLLRLNGAIPDDEPSAWEKFRTAVERIEKEGDLSAAVLEGIDPEDIPWLLDVLGAQNVEGVSPSDIASRVGPNCGALIFFCKKEEPKTHYTVVQGVDAETGDFILFDSYGFSRLTAGSRLDGETVNICHAWVVSD